MVRRIAEIWLFFNAFWDADEQMRTQDMAEREGEERHSDGDRSDLNCLPISQPQLSLLYQIADPEAAVDSCSEI